MTSQLTEIARRAPPVTVEDAHRMKASLPPLRGAYPKTTDEVAEVRAALTRLDVPASPEWIGGRIATLLMHYFVAAIPPAVLRPVAEDWKAVLKPYPQWAIEAACLWWIGPDNPKCDNKPSPGGIAKRAKAECGMIEAGKWQIERYQKYGDNPPDFLNAN